MLLTNTNVKLVCQINSTRNQH